MMPGSSPRTGLRALSAAAQAGVARRLGREAWLKRVEAPMWELSDMQPVTAAWWRERRRVPGRFFHLALGDSTAQGIGASTPGRSYLGQLTDRIESEIGESVHVTNLAVSGATSSLCARDQLPRSVNPLTKHPDLVTVAIGANDIADWDPVAYHRNLSTILDALPSHTIVGEVPCFHLPWTDRRVREANRILHAVAEARGLGIAPVYEATRRRGVRGVLTEFAGDAFHPNDRGYEVWADAFWPLVRERVIAAGWPRPRATAKPPEVEPAQTSGPTDDGSRSAV
ncbi:SGNH/GDSL hydrolase family protein [Leucobacter sp. gxy201]|uniref:SGNH/GDSL hydrolase family protein n=1 Tax=Leucobacter sp. gxy201 TaxID=2957200 RepID=UPI003DA06507